MRKVTIVLALILLIAGTGVLTYPHIQQQLYRIHVRGVIAEFEERLEQYRLDSDFHRAQSEAQRAQGGSQFQLPPGEEGGNPGSEGGVPGSEGGVPGSDTPGAGNDPFALCGLYERGRIAQPGRKNLR